MHRSAVCTSRTVVVDHNSIENKLLMRRLRALLLASVALFLMSSSAVAQAGHLDSTFGRSGKVVTGVPGPSTAIANAMAIQSDGKIVVAGGLGDGQAIGLVRYDTNGTLDGSFGNSGIALANIPNNILSRATGVVIQKKRMTRLWPAEPYTRCSVRQSSLVSVLSASTRMVPWTRALAQAA